MIPRSYRKVRVRGIVVLVENVQCESCGSRANRHIVTAIGITWLCPDCYEKFGQAVPLGPRRVTLMGLQQRVARAEAALEPSPMERALAEIEACKAAEDLLKIKADLEGRPNVPALGTVW